MWSSGEPDTNPEKPRRGTLFYELGRGSCKPRVQWRKLQVQSTGPCHWLSCGAPSLAELLPGGGGQSKCFSCCGGDDVGARPVGGGCLSSCWGQECVLGDTPFPTRCLFVNVHRCKRRCTVFLPPCSQVPGFGGPHRPSLEDTYTIRGAVPVAGHGGLMPTICTASSGKWGSHLAVTSCRSVTPSGACKPEPTSRGRAHTRLSRRQAATLTADPDPENR